MQKLLIIGFKVLVREQRGILHNKTKTKRTDINKHCRLCLEKRHFAYSKYVSREINGYRNIIIDYRHHFIYLDDMA